MAAQHHPGAGNGWDVPPFPPSPSPCGAEPMHSAKEYSQRGAAEPHGVTRHMRVSVCLEDMSSNSSPSLSLVLGTNLSIKETSCTKYLPIGLWRPPVGAHAKRAAGVAERQNKKTRTGVDPPAPPPNQTTTMGARAAWAERVCVAPLWGRHGGGRLRWRGRAPRGSCAAARDEAAARQAAAAPQTGVRPYGAPRPAWGVGVGGSRIRHTGLGNGRAAGPIFGASEHHPVGWGGPVWPCQKPWPLRAGNANHAGFSPVLNSV